MHLLHLLFCQKASNRNAIIIAQSVRKTQKLLLYQSFQQLLIVMNLFELYSNSCTTQLSDTFCSNLSVCDAESGYWQRA